MLTEELGWNEIDYSNIIFCFQLAYALGFLAVGRVIDRVGVRWGLSVAVALWSVAAMVHAAMRSVTGFCFARVYWLSGWRKAATSRARCGR